MTSELQTETKTVALGGPGPDRCIEVLDDLVQTWRADREPAEIHPDRPDAFGPVMFSMVSQVVALADGLSELWKRSRGHTSRPVAGIPLARQIIEFSIRALWLELYPERTESAYKEGVRQHRNLLNAAVEIGWIEAESEILTTLKSLYDSLEGNGNEQKLENICREVVLDGWSEKLYVYFRLASNLMHPSSLLTELHVVDEETESGVGFVTVPESPMAPILLGVATQFTVLSLLAWDREDHTQHQHDLLLSYADEFGVPASRPRRKGTSARQDARAL